MLLGTFLRLWIFLWWDKVPWLLKDFEHTVHLYDFTPEWIKRWDDIVFLLYNLQHTRCIWPFLPSADESFANDISMCPSYWKPLNIWLFVRTMNSLVARETTMIIEGHLAEITLVRFFICVNDSMQFQLLVGCKILRTNVTFGWIIMNINMVIEVALKSESPKKCWGWQNPYQKSESGPLQQQDVKF